MILLKVKILVLLMIYENMQFLKKRILANMLHYFSKCKYEHRKHKQVMHTLCVLHLTFCIFSNLYYNINISCLVHGYIYLLVIDLLFIFLKQLFV